MSKWSSVVPVVLLLAFGSGCASIPEPMVAPNGEALSVEGKTSKYTYTSKEKVGSIKTYDSKGNSSNSTVYADVKKQGTSYTWSSYQGETKIDDDDLFHIAKDDTAQAEIRDYRESGVFQNRLGWGILAVGVAAVAGGLLLYKNAGENGSKTLPGGVFLGGTFGISLGTYLIFHGIGKAEDKHPLGQARAQQAADKYNRTLP